MYNDFKLISESEILKLKNEYNKRLNKIKSLDIEDDFLEKFNKIKTNLKNASHYVENLMILSKNLEDKNVFKEIYNQILSNIENLKNLYEINETEENINLSSEIDNNINSNLKNANFFLLCFLEEIFHFLEFENNIKIKHALNNIFIITIEQLKKLNSLLKTTNLKIFSLFKKY